MSSKLNQKMSLYIPRVDTRSLPRVGGNNEEYETAAKEFIAKQFARQLIGEVDRIDLVAKKTPDGYTFYIAFVHFKVWHNTHAAHTLQQTIREGTKKATVQYHKDWYWIVTENRKPRTESELSLQDVVRTQQEEIDRLTKALAEMTALHTAPPDDVQADDIDVQADDAAYETRYYDYVDPFSAEARAACDDGHDGLSVIMDYLVAESYETQKVEFERNQSLAPPKPGRLVRQVAETFGSAEVCDELPPPPPCCLTRDGETLHPSDDEPDDEPPPLESCSESEDDDEVCDELLPPSRLVRQVSRI